MPDRELPDDHALWPGDPFALLGVAHGADERDARRAYVRLIKRFKPDHHPDHFQKIREAFDFVQRQLEIRKRFGPFDVGEEDAGEEDDLEVVEDSQIAAEDDVELMPAEEVAARSSYSLLVTPPREVPQPRPASTSLAAELWQQALLGDDAGAYAGLLRIYEQQREAGGSSPCEDGGQLFVRLYWLLTLNSRLDGLRAPCDWLAAGLREMGLIGPLAELYRRELAANPLEALSPRCDSLLACPSLPRALCELLSWRWQAAAGLQREVVILSDLTVVRDKMVFDDEVSWGQTLLNAVELLVWVPDGSIASYTQSLLGELEQLSHLHGQLGDGYDRLDMLVEVAHGWSKLQQASDIPASWCELIPLAWTRPFDELRPRMIELLRSIATYPLRALRTLDAIQDQSPAATAQLGMLIHRFRVEEAGERDDGRPWPQALELASAFFRQKLVGSYYLWRAKLLEFCLAEGIDPALLAAAMDELVQQAGATGESVGDAVRNDGPLRYVWAGTVAFWG